MEKSLLVYFDIEDVSLVNNLSDCIRKIGGECANFFSKDVTHLIINRPISNGNGISCQSPGKKGEITVTTVPSPYRSSVLKTPSSNASTQGYRQKVFGQTTPSTTTTTTTIHYPPSSSSKGIIQIGSTLGLSSTSHHLSKTYLSSHHLQSLVTTTTATDDPLLSIDYLGASPLVPSSSSIVKLTQEKYANNSNNNMPGLVPSSKSSNVCTTPCHMSENQKRVSAHFKPLHYANPITSMGGSPSVILQQSRSNIKNELVNKAAAFNMTIWTVDQLLSYLKQVLKPSDFNLAVAQQKKISDHHLDQQLSKGKSSRGGSLMNQTGHSLKPSPVQLLHSPQKSSSSPIPLVSQYCAFQYPYILIEDIADAYRPIFKEFKPMKSSRSSNVPTLYLDAPSLSCPFIKPQLSKKSKEIETVGVQCNDENSTKAHQIAKQMTNPSTQKHINVHFKWIKVKHPGYCECCLEKYSDMEEHAKQPYHRKFATNNQNYSSLDRILKELERPPIIFTEKESNSHSSQIFGTPKGPYYIQTSPNLSIFEENLFSSGSKRKYRLGSRVKTRSVTKRMMAEQTFFAAMKSSDDDDDDDDEIEQIQTSSRDLNNEFNESKVNNDQIDILQPSSPICRKFNRDETLRKDFDKNERGTMSTFFLNTESYLAFPCLTKTISNDEILEPKYHEAASVDPSNNQNGKDSASTFAFSDIRVSNISQMQNCENKKSPHITLTLPSTDIPFSDKENRNPNRQINSPTSKNVLSHSTLSEKSVNSTLNLDPVQDFKSESTKANFALPTMTYSLSKMSSTFHVENSVLTSSPFILASKESKERQRTYKLLKKSLPFSMKAKKKVVHGPIVNIDSQLSIEQKDYSSQINDKISHQRTKKKNFFYNKANIISRSTSLGTSFGSERTKDEEDSSEKDEFSFDMLDSESPRQKVIDMKKLMKMAVHSPRLHRKR